MYVRLWVIYYAHTCSYIKIRERTNRLQRRRLPASMRTAQQTAVTYTLSTGVDSRATHGTLCVMLGRYSPSFFSYIDSCILISVMVTATFRASPFPYR